MKHFYKCRAGKLCIFLTGLLLIGVSVSAQDWKKYRARLVESLGGSKYENHLILNAAITTQNEVEYLKSLNRTASSVQVDVSMEEWLNLYDRLQDAYLQTSPNYLRRSSEFLETNPELLTKNNIVPIGIMNLSSIWFTVNTKEDSNNKRGEKNSDSLNYSIIDIVYAAVLQEDVYQKDIKFKLSKDFYATNKYEVPDKIEIDFGSGYKSYALSEELISYQFEQTGIHNINIRFTSGNVMRVFRTKVNVRQLVRSVPYKEFVVKAVSNPDSNVRTALLGGNVRIVLGCDQILNKPIIIAEGFDMGQDVTLDNIEANYREHLQQYLSEGYDLVFLDYSDAREAIENNAQVLISLIKQINQMKTGNQDLIVIGESMSGLVARWALRQMENENIVHHVKLLICYDTPHQGANVPIGLVQLAWETKPTLLSQVILKFFAKGWRNFYQALNTPAAQQLLIHWGGFVSGGVGSESPAFDIFRQKLASLGNDGYPQDCRNIAVINGSINASDRRLFDDYGYGSRIIRSWTPFGLQNTNIDIHTNDINQSANIFRFATWGIFSKTHGITRNYVSPFNDDFLPGGRSAFAVPNKLFSETKAFDFCFVPTFSSIDYRGPINTQAQRELLNVGQINPALTPFAAIYGQNNNSTHVNAEAINWEAIGSAENLLTNTPACPALPVPPAPVIAVYNTCYPFSEKRTTEDNTANITVSLVTPSSGKYVHNWTVLPSNQYFTTTGDQIVFQAERADHYDVTCVRTYPDRRDLSSTFTTTFWISDCNGSNVLPQKDIDVHDIWEDDFLLTTVVDSAAVFAHFDAVSEILYATRENGDFVPRAELIASGMFTEYAGLFAITDPRVPLPVTLKSFEIESLENSLVLEWTTVHEIGSSHFEVQRSVDAKAWNSIGTVPAKNESADRQQYTFTDYQPGPGVIYYRLKIVDLDETFAFSNVQSVSTSNEVNAYPNPVSDIQNITGSVSEVEIFDSSGKRLERDSKQSGTVNFKNMPTGKYILRIHTRSGKVISKEVLHQ